MVDVRVRRTVRLLTAAALVAAGLLGPSGVAGAVTPGSEAAPGMSTAATDSAAGLAAAVEADGSDADWSLRPSAALRARADVQIRRVKTLMVRRPESVDAAIAALEKLRQALAGRR